MRDNDRHGRDNDRHGRERPTTRGPVPGPGPERAPVPRRMIRRQAPAEPTTLFSNRPTPSTSATMT
ncbi:hypothetical protein GCM10027300_41150 [Modestobacter lapidis]